MDEKSKYKVKILILGSGSFAGQAVFSNLISEGYEVYGINRSAPKDKYFWNWVNNLKCNLNDFWYEVNINDEPEKIVDIINALKPTHIIDLMGQGMVAPSWEDPKLWYSTNLSKKSYVIEGIRKLDNLEKYIRASTPEVFGSSTEAKIESSKFNPSTPYAVSHCAIDFHLRCLGQNYGFPYSIGRFANFYGSGQQLYRVIPKAILSFRNQKKFIIDGDGKSLRSFIHSEDIVSSFKKLLFDSSDFEEYNFSSKEEISILDLIKLISNVTKVDFDKFVQFGPERKGKDKIYRLDVNKTKRELNWQSKIDLDEGVKEVDYWIEENLNYLSKQSWNYIHKC